MNKMIAKITKILVLILALLIICAILAATLVDPNKYKTRISNIISKNTGREFTINGDIKWSVFPSIALHIQEVQLKNTALFDGNFIAIKDVNLKLKILPLLKKQVAIKGISVQGLHINLKRNAQGDTNFADLLALPATTNTSNLTNTILESTNNYNLENTNVIKTASSAKSKGSAFTLPNLNIGTLDVSNSSITWEDLQLKNNYKLSNLQLKAKGLDLNKNSNLPPIKLSADLTGTNISDNISFSVKAILNPVKQALKFDPIEINYAGITSRLYTEVNDVFTNINLIGNLEVLSFSPRSIFKVNNAPNNLSLKSQFKYKENLAALKNMAAEIDNGKLSGDITLDLKKLSKIDFDLTANNFDIYKLSQMLGAISIRGQSHQISTKSTVKPQGVTEEKSAILPIAALKSLNINGRLKAANTKLANNIKIDQLDCKILGEKGIIQVSPILVKVADSIHNYNVKLDVTHNKPLIELTAKAAIFEIGNFIKALGQENIVAGDTEYSIALLLQGNTIEEYKNTISGATKFSINNGTIYGIDIDKTINQALSSIRDLFKVVKGNANLNIETLITQDRSKYNLQPNPSDKSPFTTLSATTKIRGGVINNNDFLLLGPSYKATGDGVVSLPNNKITYLAKVHLQPGVESDKNLEKILLGNPIEINISGPIEKPKITPNTENFIRLAIKEAQKNLIKSFTTKTIEKVFGGSINELNHPNNNNDNSDKPESSNPVDQILDNLFR